MMLSIAQNKHWYGPPDCGDMLHRVRQKLMAIFLDCHCVDHIESSGRKGSPRLKMIGQFSLRGSSQRRKSEKQGEEEWIVSVDIVCKISRIEQSAA